MTAWGYNCDPLLLILPQITITLPHVSMMEPPMAKKDPARGHKEFRPGVFARWMDGVRHNGDIWRFDGQRWRPRNLADTGFCNGEYAAPINTADERRGHETTPGWLKSNAELSHG